MVLTMISKMFHSVGKGRRKEKSMENTERKRRILAREAERPSANANASV